METGREARKPGRSGRASDAAHLWSRNSATISRAAQAESPTDAATRGAPGLWEPTRSRSSPGAATGGSSDAAQGRGLR